MTWPMIVMLHVMIWHDTIEKFFLGWVTWPGLDTWPEVTWGSNFHQRFRKDNQRAFLRYGEKPSGEGLKRCLLLVETWENVSFGDS